MMRADSERKRSVDISEVVGRYVSGIFSVLLWSAISLGIIFVVVEVLDRKYGAVKHIFGPEDATDSAIFLGAIILGIFYMVTQFVIN